MRARVHASNKYKPNTQNISQTRYHKVIYRIVGNVTDIQYLNSHHDLTFKVLTVSDNSLRNGVGGSLTVTVA